MSTVISVAKDKCVKGSVYKVSLVARLVFRKNVNDAVKILDFCKRRAAADVRRVLYAAVANAQNNHGFSDISRLYISEVSVGKAITLKRFMARARGRGNRILKRYSNVTVKLSEIVG